MPQRAHPSKLCQRALKTPVICCVREQSFLCLLNKQRAWIGPCIIDTALGKLPLHLGERVAVLLGMLILIAQPCHTPRWFVLSIA
jgi:hypothetical protein